MTTVTVFGGTGFLGHRITERLASQGATVRVAVRHPDRVPRPTNTTGRVSAIQADVRDAASVAVAVVGADGVVNAVSAYVEKGGVTYTAVHERGARNVASQCAKHGISGLVQISGIGADSTSPSKYIRSRGRGEALVRDAFPEAAILRPSVMFGPDDAFLNALARIARSAPVFPLIGGGYIRMQPVQVDDVAAAACRALTTGGKTYELGGPQVYTLREIVHAVLTRLDLRRILVPVPFAVARAMARLLAPLPDPPLTVAQVELLQDNNVVGPTARGLQDLGIAPRRLEDILARLA